MKLIRCRFHVENTASLSINEHKVTFHCFGCGAKGRVTGNNGNLNLERTDKPGTAWVRELK